VAGVQIKMLNEISKLYGIPFSENRAKNLIAALIGTAGTGAFTGLVASCLKVIPVVGTIGGAVSMSVVAGATTFAIGKVFVQHFASGGTFLDFDPVRTRAYFEEQLREGRTVATAAAAAQKSAK
jgi:uncharacterized protein (DUF697 family)